MPIPSTEPGTFIHEAKCPNHYIIEDRDFSRLNLIQHKIENLSLKILQMEEVGYFLKENVENVSSVLKGHQGITNVSHF